MLRGRWGAHRTSGLARPPGPCGEYLARARQQVKTRHGNMPTLPIGVASTRSRTVAELLRRLHTRRRLPSGAVELERRALGILGSYPARPAGLRGYTLFL